MWISGLRGLKWLLQDYSYIIFNNIIGTSIV